MAPSCRRFAGALNPPTPAALCPHGIQHTLHADGICSHLSLAVVGDVETTNVCCCSAAVGGGGGGGEIVVRDGQTRKDSFLSTLARVTVVHLIKILFAKTHRTDLPTCFQRLQCLFTKPERRHSFVIPALQCHELCGRLYAIVAHTTRGPIHR